MLPNYDTWLYGPYDRPSKDSQREEYIAQNFSELLEEFFDAYGSQWEGLTMFALDMGVKLPYLPTECGEASWNFVVNLMKRRIKDIESIQDKFIDFSNEPFCKLD